MEQKNDKARKIIFHSRSLEKWLTPGLSQDNWKMNLNIPLSQKGKRSFMRPCQVGREAKGKRLPLTGTVWT